MSAIYNLEPQPTASLILHTTQGDLSVELFAKQTPLTARNFIQLCLDGYYDGTIFHRLVPGFILQGGDPQGTGHGGECIYDNGAYDGELDAWPADQRRGQNAGPQGINFKDEFHSRLKFNRRGLLGMANEGKPDTNGSQFFFTLDKAEELNNKNTLFGRIVGDTIYNLARMGEAEVAEGTERPLYPVSITGVEVLVNPFEDVKRRERVVAQTAPVPMSAPRKKKVKAGKKLLSFGDDQVDEPVPVIRKAKYDTRIVMDIGHEPAQVEPRKKQDKAVNDAAQRPLAVRNAPARDQLFPETTAAPRQAQQVVVEDDYQAIPEPRPKKSALEQANEEIAALKASMKRTIHSEPVKEVKKSGIEQFIPETSTRGRKRRRVGEGTMPSSDYAIYEAFRAKLQQTEAAPEKEGPVPSAAEDAPPLATGEQDEEAELCDLHFIANCQSCKAWDKVDDKEKSDDEGWLAHKLSSAADKLGKDLSYRKKAEEELVVIDPRVKARTLQEERRAEKEAKSGATGREWDQERNQKTARQAAPASGAAR